MDTYITAINARTEDNTQGTTGHIPRLYIVLFTADPNKDPGGAGCLLVGCLRLPNSVGLDNR